MAGHQNKTHLDAGKVNRIRTLRRTLLSIAALAAVSCGSTVPESNSMAINRTSNFNAANGLPSNASASIYNTANAVNVNSSRPMDAQLQRLEEMRKAANRDGKRVPTMNSRPAPENSSISVTLTDFAHETRTWKNHPVLLKVEKIHDGGEGRVKVYLRSGKVIDLAGSSIYQLAEVPAASVLEIAGVGSSPDAGQKMPTRKSKN
jgi:hypothetical protein